jgi:hypothetical protein
VWDSRPQVTSRGSSLQDFVESAYSLFIRNADIRPVLINVLIIVACVSAATLFLLLVTRTSTAPARRESNDFTGAVVAVIGTTYAVILAFTLSGVWSIAQQAQANEESLAYHPFSELKRQRHITFLLYAEQHGGCVPPSVDLDHRTIPKPRWNRDRTGSPSLLYGKHRANYSVNRSSVYFVLSCVLRDASPPINLE